MGLAEAFDADSQIYDASRRLLIPRFDDFYRVAVDEARAAAAPDAHINVLDLGAGTGLMTSMFATAFPNARFVLVDVAEGMLALARQRFAHDPRFRFVLMDYARGIPAGTFDLVISGLSIHHLEDSGKRALFARVHTALRPAGAFVNADQVLAATAALHRRHDELWLSEVRLLGASEDDIAAARKRSMYDRLATLEDQLVWLREAGFVDVDAPYRHYFFAVMSARRM